MKALRRISTRATSTATSFQNEYHYGDLKAEPVDLMGTIPHEFLASIPYGIAVYERREQLWHQAQTLADKKNPYSYDKATARVNLLFDACLLGCYRS